MQDILENNLNFLKRNFPHVNSVLDKYVSLERKKDISPEYSRDGSLNFRVVDGDRKLFLHSKYNPLNEAEALISGVDGSKCDTMVILGFGLGYHVDVICGRFGDKNKIVLEPDPELFLEIIKHKDITKTLSRKNLRLILLETWETAAKELVTLNRLGLIYYLEFMALPYYQQMYKEYWNKVQEEYVKAMRLHNVNVRTLIASVKNWVENIFNNMNNISKGADLKDFYGKTENIPAIIVSAGPSLNKNISLLKNVKNRALIVAAGSTVTAMDKVGIRPHIMFGVDGLPITSRVYNSLDWEDVYFAYTLTVHHDGLTKYKGPRIYVRTVTEGQSQWLDNYTGHVTPVIQAGGSCAHSAFSFAKALGCNPVIFIGQDLAYTNLQTHAEGRLEKTELNPDKLDMTKYIKVKDIYGQETLTTDVMLTMADTFERMIKYLYPKEHIFINATEGGISFEGAQIIPLQEALDKYCSKEIPVSETLEKIYHEGLESNRELEEKINDFKDLIRKDQEELAELSQKRLKMVDKLLKGLNEEKTVPKEKQKKRMLNLTKKIESKDLFKHFMHPFLEDLLLAYKNGTEGQAQSKHDVTEKLQVLYSGLRKQYEAVDVVNKTIGNVFENLTNSLEMENEQ